MHDLQTRQRFIELRAQGWSLSRIAGELHIAKRTLVDWNQEARREIHDLKHVELEALHERILVSHEEELTRLNGQLNRIEAVLAQRKMECLSTESLFCLAATVRAQLRRLTASPLLARSDTPPGEHPRKSEPPREPRASTEGAA
jgi:hypothetical protein